MGPTTVRVIALVLALGLIAGFGVPYLVQAGMPLWAVIVLVALVLSVPFIAIAKDKTRD